MPRVKSNVVRLKRKKQIMKLARGAFGARSKLWRPAKETVERGWRYAYRDRKNKKRDFRRLWIMRINAAAHQHDMNYSVVHERPAQGRDRGRPEDPRRPRGPRCSGVYGARRRREKRIGLTGRRRDGGRRDGDRRVTCLPSAVSHPAVS